MAARIAPKSDFVTRCVPTQDGTFMVLTKKSGAGSSPNQIPEGTAVVIRDGVAERLRA